MPRSQLRPNPHPAPGYARRAALRARPTMLSMGAGYSGKVLGTGPIAYWPLWEESGAVARCLVNPAQDGSAVGVTWADALGPDGVNGAPFFDGANDFINVWTAAFAAAFSGLEGTAMIWGRVANAGVWTDGSQRDLLQIRADVDNRLMIVKLAANDTRRWYYVANPDFDFETETPVSATTWQCLALTWSDSADQAIAYANGAQVGVVMTPVGTWAGAPVNTDTNIGCGSTVGPTLVWHGWLAHCAVWDQVLTPAEIAGLATV